MIRWIVPAGALAFTGMAAAVWFLLETTPVADPNDSEQVALGHGVYVAQCAVCHGVQLEGQANWRQRLPNGRLLAPPHDESGHTWHHPDEQLFGMIKNGMTPYAPEGYESDMPAFNATLSDEEIWAVLAYIKSSWPERIRERQDAISQRLN